MCDKRKSPLKRNNFQIYLFIGHAANLNFPSKSSDHPELGSRYVQNSENVSFEFESDGHHFDQVYVKNTRVERIFFKNEIVLIFLKLLCSCLLKKKRNQCPEQKKMYHIDIHFFAILLRVSFLTMFKK